MQLKPHSTLQDGKYEIIRPLGQGGFGITYLAEQTLMDRKVCIKEFFIKEFCERDEATSKVSLGTASNAEMMQRYMAKFIKEARTIAKLDHPNIVRIHDVFKENNTAYIVMEYINGMSLGEYIKEHGPLPEEKALMYMHKVGEALEFAHGRHIMHLDVKPSNIMLDQEHERLVLIDFGLAKQYTESGEQTSSTPVGLSQGYAPLEQYKAGGLKEFSPATDVYSLGATLYKLLIGETPPSASDVNEDGLPPLPPSISATTRQAIEKAMQPKRKDRPQSVEAFLALLDGPATEEPLNDETLVSAATKPYLQHQESAPVVTPPPAVNKAETASPEADNSTPTKPWKKYGLIGGIAVLLIVGLVALLSRGKESSTDRLLINGVQICRVELESSATEQVFRIEKNFEEKWVYSGIPKWCTATASEGIITLSVTENKTKDDRTASIYFQKKNGENALGKIVIVQKAEEAAKKKGQNTSEKAVGSVRFASTPSGAAIWIDGIDTQKTTPEIIEGLPVGKHSVKLVLSGYESYSGTVTVSSKKRMVLDRRLTESDESTFINLGDASNQGVDIVDYGAPKDVIEEEVEEEAIPFQLVEEKPSFNGGDANEFSNWVNSQLVYPEIAKENGVQGRVTLQFTVETDGRVTNVIVLRGVDESLDKEAVRVVSHSPKWTPGKQRNKPVKVTYTFPVIFQLR